MLEIDLAPALAEIGTILARAADPLPVLSRIGASEVENVRGRIRQTKRNPWGADWAPWAPSTAQHREHKGNAAQGLLWDEGDLIESIRYAVQYGTVDIGSDLDYAPYLQFGTQDMPARPFLGWNPSTFPFYEAMLGGWLEHGDERAYL